MCVMCDVGFRRVRHGWYEVATCLHFLHGRNCFTRNRQITLLVHGVASTPTVCVATTVCLLSYVLLYSYTCSWCHRNLKKEQFLRPVLHVLTARVGQSLNQHHLRLKKAFHTRMTHRGDERASPIHRPVVQVAFCRPGHCGCSEKIF